MRPYLSIGIAASVLILLSACGSDSSDTSTESKDMTMTDNSPGAFDVLDADDVIARLGKPVRRHRIAVLRVLLRVAIGRTR